MEVYDVLDELIIPLNTHLANVLSQPIDGTDAKQANFQAKKAYLELLVAIMTGRLYPVFVSSRMFCDNRFVKCALIPLIPRCRKQITTGTLNSICDASSI